MLFREYTEEDIKKANEYVLVVCPKIGYYNRDFVRCNKSGTMWNWIGTIGICGYTDGKPDMKVYDIKRYD